jgi:multiple sugar transport system ATP-binding protein
MAAISLRDVTKVFDRRVTAVSHLGLDVREGELLVLVGPSGCGKTTILRLIAGLEKPTGGEIRLGDRLANDLSPQGRDVAMVFQDGSLYPHMTVYDNLAFPLRMRRQPPAEVKRRVRAVVEMLGLADLLDRRPAALSGGQRQRVALGRAVVREPAVFLFDEPLSSLDAALRLTLRAEIQALHRRLRITMLYVTHDQSEAMALGERVGVLRDGQLQQVGRPAEVYDRPANRFVAGFFGTPPMNFLAGCLRSEGDALFLDLEGKRIAVTPGLASGLIRHAGQTVIAGIRPHDLSLETPGSPENVLSGRVVLLEHLGSRLDVHVELSPGRRCVVSATPSARADIGDHVRVHLNPEKLHWFEDDGPGRRILGDSAG